MKKVISLFAAAAMASQIAVPALAANAGDSLKVGDYAESAAETQKLIDNRPDMQRQMENLDRGVVAVKTGDYAFISWRWLGYESSEVKYNLYRDGVKLNKEPLNVTNYTDLTANDGAKYSVAAVENGVETEKSEAVAMLSNNYIDIPVEKPADNEVQGEKYTYSIGDASTGDLDGDGEYELVVKWDPSNAKDAANTGYTGECIIDAYKMDGTRLWRINMGPNIRAGAHDTQFMVFDFDGDGKAEIACRTADGTIAGDGTVIGDKDKNWAEEGNGKNLTGPLYLTVFKGEDGTVIDTVDYDPQTTGDGWDLEDWGDGYGNRSERYLASVGYLDGNKPSMIFARGYYTGPEGDLGGRTVIAAFDLVEGKIQQKWRFDTMDYENKYIGQGNHSMSTADVDYDGCDEIIYGSLAVDNDGKPMYSTELGHGDSQHVGDLVPKRPGLEVFSCHEDKKAKYSYEMRDARTGEIIWGEEQTGIDNGRACSADIDPDYEGDESWSAAGVLVAADGTVITDKYTMPANFLSWWDADLGREIQDSIYISKWNSERSKTETLFTASGCNSVNGTKATTSLTADLFGDWREEAVYPVKDQSALRIYTTTTPTSYRIPTLMHDIQYRGHVAYQNTCYNQPTHLSYHLGYDTEEVPVPQMYVVKDGKEVRNPDLGDKSWNIENLYDGERVELVIGCPTAVEKGIPKRIDNDNTEVVPYLGEGDRTMVPLKFIAESLGAEVSWNEETQAILITKDAKTIAMTIGQSTYTAGTEEKTMDTAPELKQDRTMVPLRFIAEELDENVYWNDGLIVLSDIDFDMNDEDALELKNSISSMPVPKKIEVNPINSFGEKYYSNQLDVYAVEASDNDGNLEAGAVDLDMGTRWSSYGPSTLTVDLGSAQKVSGVAVAMWKGNERIYPFTIEYSNDGETWEEALPKTQNTGESDQLEQYNFPVPVTARYIRYNGDGCTIPDKNYCHISEIAVLGVE